MVLELVPPSGQKCLSEGSCDVRIQGLWPLADTVDASAALNINKLNISQ